MKYFYSFLAVMFILLGYFGIIQLVWVNDVHHIAKIIALAGLSGLLVSHWYPSLSDLAADICVRLGILGTATGFFLLLMSIHTTGNIAEGVSGGYVAMLSTITGVFFSILLNVQSWVRYNET